MRLREVRERFAERACAREVRKSMRLREHARKRKRFLNLSLTVLLHHALLREHALREEAFP